MQNKVNIESKLTHIKNTWLKQITKELTCMDVDIHQMHILFVAYKNSNRLELYVKNLQEDAYKLLKYFPITKQSGLLGPKLKEGDLQVPEGFYFIDIFNPDSKYHLSLRINYPNELDHSLHRTGSSIYLHGGHESKGCLAVGDTAIEEIYLFALFAKENGQEHIPVYIFPFPLTSENLTEFGNNTTHENILFWKNLQEGYLQFMSSKKELKLSIQEGKYLFPSSF